jgi:transposase
MNLVQVVGWPLPDDLDDAALERRLYPVPTTTAKDWRSLPDWPAIHRELRRKGVTLQLVWEEYRAAHPDGYGRSWFCELYRAWEGRLSPTMRQPRYSSNWPPAAGLPSIAIC